jgi:hypothetical protein
VVYVDTEGFEGTGKGNAYDDRIFTLSALLSSLLVYNLPGVEECCGHVLRVQMTPSLHVLL